MYRQRELGELTNRVCVAKSGVFTIAASFPFSSQMQKFPVFITAAKLFRFSEAWTLSCCSETPSFKTSHVWLDLEI